MTVSRRAVNVEAVVDLLIVLSITLGVTYWLPAP